MSIFHKTIIATAALQIAASSAFAQAAADLSATRTTTTYSRVPEIDASTGLLAVATVAAALLFVWERRRRQNKHS